MSHSRLLTSGAIFHHELSSYDLSLCVSNGLSVVVHFKALDGVGGTQVRVVLRHALGGLAARDRGSVRTLDLI